MKGNKNFNLKEENIDNFYRKPAGGINIQSQTFNHESNDNPLSRYSEYDYTNLTQNRKCQMVNEQPIRIDKNRGNPKNLMFSNETSKGNPLDTLDQGMMDYYTDLNKRIVAKDSIKQNGRKEKIGGYDGRIGGHAGLGQMY